MDDNLPKLKGYELHELIGEGGMGRVYRGRRLSDDRSVAIKFILPSFKGLVAHHVTQRFLREIAVCKRFNHPNVVLVLDGGKTDNNIPYLVLEYLEGCALSEHDDFGDLDECLCLDIIRQVAAAFAYYHPEGLVHRDIKPSNIFLCKDGRVVLLDFGLVYADARTRLTATEEAPGTLLTMSPEQYACENLRPFTDVYQLGISLYLAACNELPLTPNEVVQYALDKTEFEALSLTEHNPRFSSGFSHILANCIKLDASKRYQSAEDLLAALDEANKGGDPIPLHLRPAKVGRQRSSYIDDETGKNAPVAPQKSGKRGLGFLIALLVVCLVFFLSRNKSSKGHEPIRDKERFADVEVLTSELLSQQTLTDGDVSVLGDLILTAKANSRLCLDEKPDPLALGYYQLARSARLSKKTTSAAKIYGRIIKRFGLTYIRPLSNTFFEEALQVTAKPKQLADSLRVYMRKASEKELPRIKIRLAQTLMRQYGDKYPDYDYMGRDLQGLIELTPELPPFAVEAASLLEKDVLLKVADELVNERVFTYFDALHTIATEEAKDRVMRSMEILDFENEQSVVQHFDALQRAVSAIARLGRDYDPKRTQPRCRRALELLEKIASVCPNKKDKSLLECLLIWVLIRIEDLERAQEIADKLQPNSLRREERWRYYWSVGKLVEEQGPKIRAKPLYKEALQLVKDHRLKYYFRRRFGETAFEDILSDNPKGVSIR